MIKECLLTQEIAEVKALLVLTGLAYEDNLDITLGLYDQNTLIATASAKDNIIKCVSVHPNEQGKQHLNTLMSALMKQLNQAGYEQVFVYTQKKYIELFKSLGFQTIVQTESLTFMEAFSDITTTLKQLKKTYQINDCLKNAVVLNANPFTLGHQHLIETAKEDGHHVLVFVVSEDISVFPFNIRFNLIDKTYKDDPNVSVLPTLHYLVSRVSFPRYFLKTDSAINQAHAMFDVLVFKDYYMPIFNIKTRFVGEEPYSKMTQVYNKTMQHMLKDKLTIIPRKHMNDAPISASTVRAHLKAQKPLERLKPLLPQATYDYLTSPAAKPVIERLKTYEHRH